MTICHCIKILRIMLVLVMEDCVIGLQIQHINIHILENHVHVE